jgi:hypothetical protein
MLFRLSASKTELKKPFFFIGILPHVSIMVMKNRANQEPRDRMHKNATRLSFPTQYRTS